MPLTTSQNRQESGSQSAIFNHLLFCTVSNPRLPLLSLFFNFPGSFSFFGRACLILYQRLEKSPLPLVLYNKGKWPNNFDTITKRGEGVCVRRPNAGPQGFRSCLGFYRHTTSIPTPSSHQKTFRRIGLAQPQGGLTRLRWKDRNLQ